MMKDMETGNEEEQKNYWLIQYRKRLDIKPNGLESARSILTPRFDPFRPFTFLLSYLCSGDRLLVAEKSICQETDINEGASIHGGQRPNGGKICLLLKTFLLKNLYLSLVSPANISGRKSKPVSMNIKKWAIS